MIKSTFALLLYMIVLLITSSAYAQDQFCFDMVIGSSTKRVRVSFWGDEWKQGSVQYQGQKSAVQIRLKSEEVAENYEKEGRPNLRDLIYEEVVGGQVTGTYSFSIQGAVFYGGEYMRRRDQKKFEMRYNNGMTGEDCFTLP